MNLVPGLSIVYSYSLTTANVENVYVPLEILQHIFDNFEFANVVSYPEYKQKILKKELTRDEVQYRLIYKNGLFVTSENEYGALVKQVYAIALCCKAFCHLTYGKRVLLQNALSVEKDGCNGFFKQIEKIKDESREMKVQDDCFREVYQNSIAEKMRRIESEIKPKIAEDNTITRTIRGMLDRQMSLQPLQLPPFFTLPSLDISLNFDRLLLDPSLLQFSTIQPLILTLPDAEEYGEITSEEEEKSLPPTRETPKK